MGRFTKSLLAFLGIIVLIISSGFFAYVREAETLPLEQEIEQKKEAGKGRSISDEINEAAEKENVLRYNGVGAYEAYSSVSENDLYIKIRDVGMALIFLVAILGSAALLFSLRKGSDQGE